MKHVHLEAVAVAVGLAAAITALTGHPSLAIALLAVLTTAALALGLRFARRLTRLHTVADESVHDLRQITEQVQRRTIAAMEKLRLEAGDRHLELIGAIATAERLTADDIEELLRVQVREIEAMTQLKRMVAPRVPATDRPAPS